MYVGKTYFPSSDESLKEFIVFCITTIVQFHSQIESSFTADNVWTIVVKPRGEGRKRELEEGKKGKRREKMGRERKVREA